MIFSSEKNRDLFEVRSIVIAMHCGDFFYRGASGII